MLVKCLKLPEGASDTGQLSAGHGLADTSGAGWWQWEGMVFSPWLCWPGWPGWPGWPAAQRPPLPRALPAAAAAAGAPGTRPGCRPRARSGFQEAGREAFQPSLAVAAAAGRAPSRPAAARWPACPLVPSGPRFGQKTQDGHRRTGSGPQRALAGRAAQVAARALRLWARASAALRAPGGAGQAGRPRPSPI